MGWMRMCNISWQTITTYYSPWVHSQSVLTHCITASCVVFGRWRSQRSWRTSLVGVLKWGGVGVYLLTTPVWQLSTISLRNHRSGITTGMSKSDKVSCTYRGGHNDKNKKWRCRYISDSLLVYRLKITPAKNRALYCTTGNVWCFLCVLVEITVVPINGSPVQYSAPRQTRLPSCGYHLLICCPYLDLRMPILRRSFTWELKPLVRISLEAYMSMQVYFMFIVLRIGQSPRSTNTISCLCDSHFWG